MEKTRSPFQQIIDYRMFVAFLVLFTRAVFVESVTDLTTTNVLSTLPSKKGNVIGKMLTTDGLATTTVHTSASTFTPSTKGSLSSSLPSEQPPVVTQVASTFGKKISALQVNNITLSPLTKEPGPKNATSVLHITAEQKEIDTQSDSPTPSSVSATTASIGIVSNITAVVQKVRSTSGTLTMSSKIIPTSKSLRPRSKGGPEQSKGKGLITTPGLIRTTPGPIITTPGQGMHPKSTQTPDMSHDRGTSQTSRIGTTVSETTAPPSSRKHSVVLITAMVVFFLLILALVVACLYCRRRRRSGSTSFNTARWAGQAALPDDTGLDKDVEQAPLATGEKEARRATLTTFFGKRQSRVASIAMEEIDGKEKEEAQQLIGGNAGRDSSPEGPGEANGKVSTQEETPPTRIE